MRGKLFDVARSFEGRLRVTFEVDAVDEIRGMEEKDLDITVKPHREKRSLNANAYAWCLIGKIADALRISKDEAYLIMLKRYGQSDFVSVLSSVNFAGYFKYYEPVGTATLQGKEFTHYRVFKGSSEYDTREMSVLIDGIVEEAKELGIETLVPSEIERMKKAWQDRYCNKNESVLYAEPQLDYTSIM